jgi:hypothetical protein
MNRVVLAILVATAWVELTVLTVAVAIVPYVNTGEPKILASCTMNGMGKGDCDFLNEGAASGAQYITIILKNSRTGKAMNSAPIYSGLVQARDIRERKFSMPGVDDFCTADFNRGESWLDVCSFTIVPLGD